MGFGVSGFSSTFFQIPLFSSWIQMIVSEFYRLRIIYRVEKGFWGFGVLGFWGLSL